mmetsp:Transcript_22254/g.53373  ORF Transcript_22254/g.53373 Transcript_22254/m.53373 type:complete len:287 (+) Transcript_22254:190-1050(+)
MEVSAGVLPLRLDAQGARRPHRGKGKGVRIVPRAVAEHHFDAGGAVRQVPGQAAPHRKRRGSHGPRAPHVFGRRVGRPQAPPPHPPLILLLQLRPGVLPGDERSCRAAPDRHGGRSRGLLVLPNADGSDGAEFPQGPERDAHPAPNPPQHLSGAGAGAVPVFGGAGLLEPLLLLPMAPHRLQARVLSPGRSARLGGSLEPVARAEPAPDNGGSDPPKAPRHHHIPGHVVRRGAQVRQRTLRPTRPLGGSQGSRHARARSEPSPVHLRPRRRLPIRQIVKSFEDQSG